MAMNVDYKLVTGDIEKVKQLVTEQKINPGALCITSVGDMICLVRKDNSVAVLSADEHIFESKEEATTYLSTPAAKAGQIVTIKEGDSYKQFIVNPKSDGGFELNEQTGTGTSNPTWEEL